MKELDFYVDFLARAGEKSAKEKNYYIASELYRIANMIQALAERDVKKEDAHLYLRKGEMAFIDLHLLSEKEERAFKEALDGKGNNEGN